MSGLPIPNDWNEQNDGYCDVSLSVPNSPLWRGMLRGAIYSLAFPYRWDKQTGDQEQAAEIALGVFDSVLFSCVEPVPIYLDVGTVLNVAGNVWTLQAGYIAEFNSYWLVPFVNHDSIDYINGDVYKITVEPQNYTPMFDPFCTYERDDSEISCPNEMTDFCHPNFGWFEMGSANPFTAIVTIGEQGCD